MQLLDSYDLFIFDWDNTVSSSTAPIRAMQLLKKDIVLWYAKSQRERYSREITLRIDDFVNRSAKSSFYATLYDTYARFFMPRLKRNAIEVLKLLKARRKKVAVFSDSRTYRLFRETRALGVLKYVDIALAAETIDRYKPDPAGLLLIMNRFKVSKARTVYIGDMATDILTAQHAGVTSWGVADGLDDYDVLKSVGANRVFRDLGSLLSVISSR